MLLIDSLPQCLVSRGGRLDQGRLDCLGKLLSRGWVFQLTKLMASVSRVILLSWSLNCA